MMEIVLVSFAFSLITFENVKLLKKNFGKNFHIITGRLLISTSDGKSKKKVLLLKYFSFLESPYFTFTY